MMRKAEGGADCPEEGVGIMHWDLGMKGLAFLVVMSLGFGLIAQAVAGGATTRWLWVIASVAYFIGALFASEIWFGGGHGGGTAER